MFRSPLAPPRSAPPRLAPWPRVGPWGRSRLAARRQRAAAQGSAAEYVFAYSSSLSAPEGRSLCRPIGCASHNGAGDDAPPGCLVRDLAGFLGLKHCQLTSESRRGTDSGLLTTLYGH